MAVLMFALLGALITGGTAIFQYLEKQAASEKADRKDKDLQAANAELIEANKKIIELQNNALKQITGGKNLPVLIIAINGSGKRYFDLDKRVHSKEMYYDNKVLFYLVNGGKYTLKNVLFSIQDKYNKPVLSNKNITPYNYKNQTFTSDENFSYHNIDVKNLTLKSRKLVYSSKLPQSIGNGKYSFDVVIEWSNGLYQAHIDLIEKDGSIAIEVKYYDEDGKEIAKEILEKNINDGA